jgi:hypothetical protein
MIETMSRISQQMNLKLEQLRKSLMQPPKPAWHQLDLRTQQKSVPQTIKHVLVNVLVSDPKFPPISRLKLSDQRRFFKALSGYAELEGTALLKSMANQDMNHKKISAARRSLINNLELFYDIQDKNSQKKLLKKMKLMALLMKAKAKAEEERLLQYQQENEQNKQNQPLPIPTPTPILEPSDVDLLDQLEILGLPLNATHKDVEAAYQAVKAEYNRHPNPSSTMQQIFHQVNVAYLTLIATPAERLQEMIVLKIEELSELRKNLQPFLPNSNLDEKISLENIRKAYLEYGVQNATAESPVASTTLRQTHLTIQKLEYHYGSTPQQGIQLGAAPASQAGSASPSSTPTPTPAPKK